MTKKITRVLYLYKVVDVDFSLEPLASLYILYIGRLAWRDCVRGRNHERTHMHTTYIYIYITQRVLSGFFL